MAERQAEVQGKQRREASLPRIEPARNALRLAGRVVLWAFVGLIIVRGVEAILSGDADGVRPAQATRAAAPAWPDDTARAFAVQFSRAYLTFTPLHPEYQEVAVRPYLSESLRDQAALSLPKKGPSQTVTSATVAGARTLSRRRALITVALTVLNETVTTRYLTVPVARDARGGLVVFDYPAFTSPPATGAVRPEPDTAPLSGEDAAEIKDLLTRFLVAYLGGERADQLSYFVARGADITALGQPYRPTEVISFARSGPVERRKRTVLVTVRTRDAGTGATYLLRYRIGLVRGDRWYVASLAGGIGGA